MVSAYSTTRNCHVAKLAPYSAASVIDDHAIHNHRAASYARDAVSVACHNTVSDNGATLITADGVLSPIAYLEPFQHRVLSLCRRETEPARRSLAINDTMLRPVFGFHGNGSPSEVYIAIPSASIQPVGNHHRVAIDSLVDRGLDIVEIGGAVVINSDDSPPTRARHCQGYH
jgi:hypothetical protein